MVTADADGATPAPTEPGGPSGTGGGLRQTGYRLWTGLLRTLGTPWDDGVNVFDREWDLLVLLDACRVDALEAVASEYDFVEGVGRHRSPASNSPEWLERTFDGDHAAAVAETAYVTANPHSDELDADRFALVDEVWRYAWDGAGTVRPTDLTDRVVDVMRTHRPTRLIAHYMQPHLPFRAEAYPAEATVAVDEYLGHAADGERNVYHRLRDGEVSRDAVWTAYLDNLRWVLDDVETLLESVDADRVVLSADHAELFGEWGCYCHPRGVPLPALRAVPWVETTARDVGDYEPTLDPPDGATESGDGDVSQHLRDLGYL